MKKRIHLSIFFIIFLITCCPSHAKIYFVKNGGNDSNEGMSDENAWASIKKVNSFHFSNGDTLCLKRGSVFTDETLKSPDVDNFTIKDYGTGKKPRIDGNYIKPIDINPKRKIKRLTIKNIDISGSNWTDKKDTALTVINADGLIIDGIYGDGHRDGGKCGKNAIFIGGITFENTCTGSIEIRNCELVNYGPEAILTKGIDFMGILLGRISSGDISVHNNVIHDVTADCMQIFQSTAEIHIFENTLYNAGENSIDIKSSSNVKISDNKLYRESGFMGDGGSGGGSIVGIHDPYKMGAIENIVVTGNIFEGGDRNDINISGVSDIRIYNNIFHGGTGRGINVGKSQDIHIFQNRFEKIKGNINIKDKTDNLAIYDNIFINPDTLERQVGVDGGCIYENNGSTKVTKIFNNTIYGSGSCLQLIAIACSQGTVIENNIVYQASPLPSAVPLYVGSCGMPAIINGNCLYNNGRDNIINYKGTNLDYKDSTSLFPCLNNLFSDPLFQDPTKGDLSLRPGSPCTGKGAIPN